METTTIYAGKLLAGLLGAADNLFEPVNWSWPENKQYPTLWQTRQDWVSTGLLPWSNPGVDAADRKAYDRAGSSLEAAGLAAFGARGQAGLTATGLEKARGLCQRLLLADAIPGLDYMLSLKGSVHEFKDRGAVAGLSECSLANLDAWPKKSVGENILPDSAYWIINAVVPLSVAGYVEHKYRPHFPVAIFRLTKEGAALADERKKSGEAAPGQWLQLATRPEASNERDAPAAYWAGWDRMRDHLATAKPPRPNSVDTPLNGCFYPPQLRIKLQAEQKKS